MELNYRIFVPRGPFPNAAAAAHAEDRVLWLAEETAEMRACTLCWAALDAASFLPGKTEVLAAEDSDALPRDPGAETVLLGSAAENPLTAALEKLTGIPLGADASVGEEGYRLKGIVWDGRRLVVISGGSRIGTAYGLYAWCERQGCLFTEPEIPCVRPETRDPAEEFDLTEQPAFVTRGTFSSYIHGDDAFLTWMIRNRMNFTKFKGMAARRGVLKKLGIRSSEGGHVYFDRFLSADAPYPYRHAVYGGEGKPADPYPVSPDCRAPASGKALTFGDAHPEWFALVGGERMSGRGRDRSRHIAEIDNGYNLCTGNPDARRELCRRAAEDLISGAWKDADYVDVWPKDGGTWCECPLCRAQGNRTSRILRVACDLDLELKKATAAGRLKRRVRLIIPAYHETLPVPDRPLPEELDRSNVSVVFFPIERCYAHDIDDPVCRSNAQLMAALTPWTEPNGAWGGELFIGEYYNVSSFAAMPFVLTSRILHDVPLYYHLGVRHFHYMHISSQSWGFIALNNWLYAALLWNPNADGEALTSKYFSARYGEKADGMRSLYERLEKASANCKYFKHYQFYDDGVTPGRIALRDPINAGVPCTEEALFPLRHMKLRGRADDPQAGISLEEMADAYTALLRELQNVCEGTDDPFLRLDLHRMTYGERMTRFFLALCLCWTGNGDEATLEWVLREAEALSKTREGLEGYFQAPNLENLLGATWVREGLRKRYGIDKKET